MANEPHTFEFLNWAWTVLSLPIGWTVWLIKSIINDQRNLEKDVNAHKLYAANNFVKNSHLDAMEDRILKAIGEIKSDLKSKADK